MLQYQKLSSFPVMKIFSKHWSLKFKSIVFRITQFRFCQKDQGLAARLRKRMDFPNYQVIQYIPSISLLEIGKQRFQKYMLTQPKLHQLGTCLGYDILTNNSDRFKLSKIWSSTNEGNIANILINVPDHFLYNHSQQIKNRQNLQVPLGQYFFIDHSGYLLDIQKNVLAAQNFKKYIDKVTIFQDQIINFLRHQLPCPEHFLGLITQIQFFTKYRLSQQNIITIIEGIIYATDRFIVLWEEKVIQSILEELKRGSVQSQQSINNKNRPQIQYWDDYWNVDLAKIKLNHLEQYYLKINAIYMTYSELIRGICQKVRGHIQGNKGDERKSSKRISKNNSRAASNNSNLSKQSLEPENLNQNKNSQNMIHQNEDPYQFNNQKENQNQKLHNQQKVRVISEGIGRRKLKQKLQAFQKKNYQNQQN